MLTYKQLNTAVQALAQRDGKEGRFSTHSLRTGALHALIAAGFNEVQNTTYCRWAGNDSMAHYRRIECLYATMAQPYMKPAIQQVLLCMLNSPELPMLYMPDEC